MMTACEQVRARHGRSHDYSVCRIHEECRRCVDEVDGNLDSLCEDNTHSTTISERQYMLHVHGLVHEHPVPCESKTSVCSDYCKTLPHHIRLDCMYKCLTDSGASHGEIYDMDMGLYMQMSKQILSQMETGSPQARNTILSKMATMIHER
jgi:hypothetical protein